MCVRTYVNKSSNKRAKHNCNYMIMYIRVETKLSHLVENYKISRSDADSALTALLEYFDLLIRALKGQSCQLFSNHLAY